MRKSQHRQTNVNILYVFDLFWNMLLPFLLSDLITQP